MKVKKEQTKTSVDYAKTKALYLLQNSSYTEQRMIEKLTTAGCTDDAIKGTISFLKEYRYLDDFNYSCSYIRLHFSKCSIKKMEYTLLQRGVDAAVVKAAFATIEEELTEPMETDAIKKDIENYRRKIAGKQSKLRPEETTEAEYNSEYQEEQRLIGHLYRKGYSVSQIRATLKHIE